MTNGTPDEPKRLDSWKAIAAYLQRDERTVRRWEREQGLPVRRVPGGRGSSVFAYASEIDAWLTSAATGRASGSVGTPATAEPAEARADAAPPDAPIPNGRARLFWSRRFIVSVAGLLLAAAGIWSLTPHARDAAELRYEASPAGVRAIDADGRERWRHSFPAGERVTLLDRDQPVRAVRGRSPGVLVGVGLRHVQGEDLLVEGDLSFFDPEGRRRRTFAFDDTVTFGGRSFGPPWMLTSFAVDETPGGRRIAVAAHHATWDPGLVTVLDADWRRQGTFVHAGWIEAVRWLPSGRLLTAGFSNPHDGGLVALLDPDRLDGQGPEPAGGPSHCESCGAASALRMVVLPRTEINRVTESRFNRAVVLVTPDRIVARSIEADAIDNGIHGAVEVVYEFHHDLTLVAARVGEQYWARHRALEAEGRLDHPRDRCPDRDGPHTINVWDPARGWRTEPVTPLPGPGE